MIGLDRIPYDRMPDRVAISALTLAELTAGPVVAADRSAQARRADRLRRVRASFETLAFDTSCARSYGCVYEAVLEAGRKPRGSYAVDLMIAATALAHELPFFTLNVVDLRGLDGLIEIVDLS